MRKQRAILAAAGAHGGASASVPAAQVPQGPEACAATRKPRLLAVASGGGHWVELMRLEPVFESFDTVFVSTFQDYAAEHPNARYYTVPFASRFHPWTFGEVLVRAVRIFFRERPEAIITTGSAPMLVFVLLGRLFGARTLWIDSIANPERLSGSGRIAKHAADRCVSQWEQVAHREGLDCWGSIL